jgi:phosphonate transport system substrate-binding protein
LLRRWKKGVAEYHTIIVARRDTAITDLDGLLGQTIAFDDRVSTSGYLLPKGHLTRLGYKLTEKISASSGVAPEEIGYVFAGDEENVRTWVLHGETAAAAIPSSDYEELDADSKSELRILQRTPAVPRHIALARPGLQETLQKRIVELLSNMHETTEGQAALATFERTKKFDALPKGPQGTIEIFRGLFALD